MKLSLSSQCSILLLLLVVVSSFATGIAAVRNNNNNNNNNNKNKNDNVPSSCGLWVAKSTIPGASLGVFNGDDPLDVGSILDKDQIAIPLHDVEWNNDWAFLLEDDDDDDDDNGAILRNRKHNWRNYLMTFFINPDTYGLEEEMSDDTHIFSPGIGSLACCHFGLNNCEEPNSLTYDVMGFHRSQDPGVGAFSAYHEYQVTTIQTIPPGSEIFGSYGTFWFEERVEEIGFVPFVHDWDQADEFLQSFQQVRLLLLLLDDDDDDDDDDDVHHHHSKKQMTPEMQHDLWDLFVQDDWEDFQESLYEWIQEYRHHPAFSNDKLLLLEDLQPIILQAAAMDPRVVSALPGTIEDAIHAMEVGIFKHELDKSTRSKEWLQEHGRCMDMIRPGNSTIPQAGRGAFANRNIQKDGLVGHAPLLHVPNKAIFNIYEALSNDNSKRRNISNLIGYQMMTNYCFGHSNSSVLLCPYGSTTPYINHNSIEPNTKIQWATDTEWFDPGCLDLTPSEFAQRESTCLALDYIALRDIKEGEEILIDYGDEWEEAWLVHLKNWVPLENSQNYVRSADLNNDTTSPIKTLEEQKKDPYSNNIMVGCQVRSKWFHCKILERTFFEDDEDDEGGQFYYTVLVPLDDGETYTLDDLTREDIRFLDYWHTDDEFLSNAFRHPMMIPSEMFPDVWLNTDDGDSDGDGDGDGDGDEDEDEDEEKTDHDHISAFEAHLIEVGEVRPITWKDTGKAVNQYSVRIGLDSKLTEELLNYANRLGLTDMYWSLEYDDPIAPGNHKFVKLNGNGNWYINRPEAKWKSNMHWVQPANEWAHEEYLKVLASGGFDQVLEAIGNYYDHLDGLFVQGVGFIGVSHCSQGYVHQDMSETGGRFFNVLIPLILEEDSFPEFLLRDDDDQRESSVKYMLNEAIMVGDDAYHATDACDYRESRGMRMGASIYIADINQENLETITADTTTIFPVPEDTDWAMAQQARHWKRNGDSSLANDHGRKSLTVKDRWEDCPRLAEQGLCETDIWSTRANCVKSCKLYMEKV